MSDFTDHLPVRLAVPEWNHLGIHGEVPDAEFRPAPDRDGKLGSEEVERCDAQEELRVSDSGTQPVGTCVVVAEPVVRELDPTVHSRNKSAGERQEGGGAYRVAFRKEVAELAVEPESFPRVEVVYRHVCPPLARPGDPLCLQASGDDTAECP